MIVVIVLAATLTALFSYCFGPVIAEEYFDQVIFTTRYSLRGLLQGHVPYWIPHLALGIPNSHPQNLVFHPLSLVFLLFSLSTANAVFIFVNLGVSLYFMSLICGRFGMSPASTLLTLATYLLSSANVDYTVLTFAPSTYVQWAMFPMLFYVSIRLLEASTRDEVVRYALAWVCCCGFIVVNSHPTHFAASLSVLAVFLVVHAAAAARGTAESVLRTLKIGALCVGVALVAILSAEKIVAISTERALFSGDAIRTGSSYGFRDLAWHWLVRPFVLPVARDGFLPTLSATVTKLTDRAAAPFALFFGLPFVLLGLSWCVVGPRRETRRRLAFGTAFLVSLAAMKAPLRVVPEVIGGGVPFRDPAVFFGILMGGLGFNALRIRASAGGRRLVAAMGVAQVVLLMLGAAPWFAAVVQRHRSTAGFACCRGKGFAWQEVDAKVLAEIRRQIRDKNDRVYIYAGPVALADLADVGLNVLGLGFVKGISLDIFYRSRLRMYGLIPGEHEYYVGGRYRRPIEPGDSLLLNTALLDVLSVNSVIARRDDQHAEGLRVVGGFRSVGGGEAVILRNDSAWPKAFFVPPALRDVTVPRRDGCWHGRLLCGDFTRLRTLPAGSDPVEVDHLGDVIKLRFRPVPAARMVLVSEMHRPGWVARGAAGTRPTFPLLEAFIGTEVPAGASELTLAYRPTPRVVARYMEMAGWIATLGAIVWWWSRRNNRERSADASVTPAGGAGDRREASARPPLAAAPV